MKKMFKKYYGYQWLAAIIFGWGLPFLGELAGWTSLHKVIFIYIILNSAYMLYLGYDVRRHGYSPVTLLLMPIIFAIVATLWVGLVSISYGFYFSLLYVVLSLFTFLGDTRDDPDENLIPIENGFHDLNSGESETFQIPVEGGFKS